MARKESVQSGGIVFGDWKLMPVDSRNWELCKRGDSGWRPLGRFYQCNTLDAAIQYAADCELKDEYYDRATGLCDALAEYRAIVDGMVAAVTAAVRGE